MRIQKLLAAIVLAGASGLAVPAMGCYATTDVQAYDEPPPPREEVVVARPGYFWIHGHWYRDGGSWRWRSGYYERERADQVYNEGRWERRGNHHIWVEGSWRARRGGVVVREHHDYD